MNSTAKPMRFFGLKLFGRKNKTGLVIAWHR